MTKKRVIWFSALIVAGAIFLGCTVYFIRDYLHYRSITNIGAYNNSSAVSQEKTDVEVPINFEELNRVNEDIYAWINIPGDDPESPLVDYPILQSSPDVDYNYYLKHDVNKKSSGYGAIYTQCYNNKDFGDFNTLIYGHNMRYGAMFGSLKKYRDKTFFDNHRDINIYMPGRILKYRIFAAYVFDYRHILLSYDFSNEAARQLYLEEALNQRKLSANYSDDIEVGVNDKIITLSTCTSNKGERYLVQGVLVYDSNTEN